MLWSPKILTKIECSGAKFSPGHNFGVNSKKWPKKNPRDALFPVRSRLAVARGASYCWLSECTSAPAAFCLLLFWDTQHGVYLTSWLPYSADSLWLGFVSCVPWQISGRNMKEHSREICLYLTWSSQARYSSSSPIPGLPYNGPIVTQPEPTLG